MLKKVYGHTFAKEIRIKIVIGKKVMKHCYRADPGRMFGEKEVEKTIENVVDWIERSFPRLEFKMVQLLPNVFNFIAIGEREFQAFVKEAINETVESSPNERNSENGVSEEGASHPDVSPVEPTDVQLDDDNSRATADAPCQSGSTEGDHSVHPVRSEA